MGISNSRSGNSDIIVDSTNPRITYENRQYAQRKRTFMQLQVLFLLGSAIVLSWNSFLAGIVLCCVHLLTLIIFEKFQPVSLSYFQFGRMGILMVQYIVLCILRPNAQYEYALMVLFVHSTITLPTTIYPMMVFSLLAGLFVVFLTFRIYCYFFVPFLPHDEDNIMQLSHIFFSLAPYGVIVFSYDNAKNAFILALMKEKLEKTRWDQIRFIKKFAHCCRTYLNGINIFHIQLKSRNDNRNNFESFDLLEDNITHTIALVNDLVDFHELKVKQLTLNPVVGNLYDCVLKVIRRNQETLNRLQKHKLSYRNRLERSVPNSARFDPLRFSQIMDNLVSNAIKYSEKGYVQIICYCEGTRFHFQVEDTGPGIPIDKLKDVFTPFSSISRSSKPSLGLGLVISKEISMLMKGGELRILSEGNGKGVRAIFKCDIDVVEEDEDEEDDDDDDEDERDYGYGYNVYDDVEEDDEFEELERRRRKERRRKRKEKKAKEEIEEEKEEDPRRRRRMDGTDPGLPALPQGPSQQKVSTHNNIDNNIREGNVDFLNLDNSEYSKLRVLVVEDVLTNRTALGGQLNRLGVEEIDYAENGVDALETMFLSACNYKDGRKKKEKKKKKKENKQEEEKSKNDENEEQKEQKEEEVEEIEGEGEDEMEEEMEKEEESKKVVILEEKKQMNESESENEISNNINNNHPKTKVYDIDTRKLPYDLVLMDINMPVMDGETCTDNIRKHWTCEDLPVYAVTAKVFTRKDIKSYQNRFNGIVRKPFKPKDIKTVLDEVLEQMKKNYEKTLENRPSTIEFEISEHEKRVSIVPEKERNDDRYSRRKEEDDTDDSDVVDSEDFLNFRMKEKIMDQSSITLAYVTKVSEYMYYGFWVLTLIIMFIPSTWEIKRNSFFMVIILLSLYLIPRPIFFREIVSPFLLLIMFHVFYGPYCHSARLFFLANIVSRSLNYYEPKILKKKSEKEKDDDDDNEYEENLSLNNGNEEKYSKPLMVLVTGVFLVIFYESGFSPYFSYFINVFQISVFKKDYFSLLQTPEIMLDIQRINFVTNGLYLSQIAMNMLKLVLRKKEGRQNTLEFVTFLEADNTFQDNFAAKISHDLRAPIFSSQFLVSRLRAEFVEDRYFINLSRCLNDLKRETDNLVDFYRLKHGKFSINKTKIYLQETLSECVTEFLDLYKLLTTKERNNRVANVWKKNEEEELTRNPVMFAFECDNLPVCVYGDKDRLVHILVNLVSNSLEHTKTGSIVIKARFVESKRIPILSHDDVSDVLDDLYSEDDSEDDSDDEKEGEELDYDFDKRKKKPKCYRFQKVENGVVYRRSECSGLCFRVEDTGNGMNLDLQNKVFKKGFPFDTKMNALGLGLHVSNEMLRKMGGGLILGSKVKRGTRMEVFYPLQLLKPGEDPSSGIRTKFRYYSSHSRGRMKRLQLPIKETYFEDVDLDYRNLAFKTSPFSSDDDEDKINEEIEEEEIEGEDSEEFSEYNSDLDDVHISIDEESESESEGGGGSEDSKKQKKKKSKSSSSSSKQQKLLLRKQREKLRKFYSDYPVKICVVEDNIVCMKMMRFYIEKVLGYRDAIYVTTGKKALHLVDSKIDIAFVDFFLPDMNALELIPKIKEVNDHTEFCLVTGNAASANVRKIAVEVVQKPVKLTDVRMFILEAWRKKIGRTKKRKIIKGLKKNRSRDSLKNIDSVNNKKSDTEK